MGKVIMEIPNQQFCFLADWDVDENDDKIRIDFSKMHFGTIYLVTDVYEGDEDALAFFGVPNGESRGHIAFWLHGEKFSELWEKMIKEKQRCLKEEY